MNQWCIGKGRSLLKICIHVYMYTIVKGKFISLEVVDSIFSIALLHFTDSRVSFSWLCDACNTDACFLSLLFYKCLCTYHCINQFCFKLRNLLIHIASHFVVFKF